MEERDYNQIKKFGTTSLVREVAKLRARIVSKERKI